MTDATEARPQTAPYPPYGPYAHPAPPRKPRRRWPWITAAAGGAVVVIMLAAAIAGGAKEAARDEAARSSAANSTAVSPPAIAAPSTSYPPAPESTWTPTPSDEAEPTDTGGETTAIGQSASWEDGVSATVVSVRRTSFGQYATTPGQGLKVTVKITNGSTAAIDLFPTMDVRLGNDGVTAEQVYSDGCDGLSDFGRLAPKRTVTGTVCFAGKASTVDISFAPGFEYNALTWTGKVG